MTKNQNVKKIKSNMKTLTLHESTIHPFSLTIDTFTLFIIFITI